MGHSSRNMEESSADNDLNYVCPAQDAAEGNNINMNSWTTDHSCHLLATNVSTFSSCPKNLLEAKLKSFRLMALVEEISRWPSIDCVTWLLLIMVMQIYNGKKSKQ